LPLLDGQVRHRGVELDALARVGDRAAQQCGVAGDRPGGALYRPGGALDVVRCPPQHRLHAGAVPAAYRLLGRGHGLGQPGHQGAQARVDVQPHRGVAEGGAQRGEGGPDVDGPEAAGTPRTAGGLRTAHRGGRGEDAQAGLRGGRVGAVLGGGGDQHGGRAESPERAAAAGPRRAGLDR
jgi:hypothetical protein